MGECCRRSGRTCTARAPITPSSPCPSARSLPPTAGGRRSSVIPRTTRRASCSRGCGSEGRRPREDLVVRLGALGDIVHTVPAVAALRRGLPSRADRLAGGRAAPRGRGSRRRLDVRDRGRSVGQVARAARDRAAAARDALRRRAGFPGAAQIGGSARGCPARAAWSGFSRHALRERTAARVLHEHRGVPRGQHVIAKNLALAGVLGVDVSDVAFPFDVPRGSPRSTGR